MAVLQPLYTRENCRFSCPLQWGLTIFWREPTLDDGWQNALAAATREDGIRLLKHRFSGPGVSQLAVSTQPHVPPLRIVERVKGRLQYLVRERHPRALRGNYALRSVGHVSRETTEGYVAGQLGHHPMADPRIQARLKRYQVECREVDLKAPQRTSHGTYWYNLHAVLVHRERWAGVRDEVLRRLRDMVLRSSAAKGIRLSRAGLLPDHMHLVAGCPIHAAPDEVILGFLNNLAYVHEMKPVYQYGGFVGTVGEYTTNAL